MNTEEPWNPNADLIVEKGSTYQGYVAAEECRKVSGMNRLMQRPSRCRFKGRRRRRCLSSSGSRGGRRCEEARGKMERTPGLIYKGKGISDRRENRGAKNRISDTVVASIFGDQLIKKKSLWVFYADDIMAVYGDFRRWRHGGLQGQHEDVQIRISLSWRLTWTSSNQSGA